MTNKQLHLLKKKYLHEGYKMAKRDLLIENNKLSGSNEFLNLAKKFNRKDFLVFYNFLNKIINNLDFKIKKGESYLHAENGDSDRAWSAIYFSNTGNSDIVNGKVIPDIAWKTYGKETEKILYKLAAPIKGGAGSGMPKNRVAKALNPIMVFPFDYMKFRFKCDPDMLDTGKSLEIIAYQNYNYNGYIKLYKNSSRFIANIENQYSGVTYSITELNDKLALKIASDLNNAYHEWEELRKSICTWSDFIEKALTEGDAEFWREFSDSYGYRFITTLDKIVDYINEHYNGKIPQSLLKANSYILDKIIKAETSVRQKRLALDFAKKNDLTWLVSTGLGTTVFVRNSAL